MRSSRMTATAAAASSGKIGGGMIDFPVRILSAQSMQAVLYSGTTTTYQARWCGCAELASAGFLGGVLLFILLA